MKSTGAWRGMVGLFLVLGAAAGAAGATVFPGAEWEDASPESQGVDSARLAEAVAYLKANSGRDGVKELVIVRHGRMIWKGEAIDNVHGVWSATKSFTSTVLGLLVDDRKCMLDTRARDIVPELAAAYPAVTLRHFTTMTSGYKAVGDEPAKSHGQSRTPFDPSPEPLFAPPGSKYAYWDSAMNQFGQILARIAGEPIEDLFQRRIADPIGMNRAKWDWGDFGERGGVVVNGGSGNAGKHIQTSLREMARFALLFLNRGRWNGRQLINAAWVDQATSVQVPASMPLAYPIDARGTYGFNWWVNGVNAEGQCKWPGVPAGAYSASGHNNNDIFIIPEWDMVVVRLGLDQQTDGPISDETYNAFLEKIGRAIRTPGAAAGRTPDASDPAGPTAGVTVVNRTRKARHPIVLTFRCPRAAEMHTTPNPFLDDRFQVAFTGPAGRTYHVPGTFDGARQR